MRIAAALSVALVLVACGGGSADPDPNEETSVARTSGGETEAAPHPIRTTIPVPVPQPAVAREELSEPLQQVWTQIEETVALRPPDPPEEATEEAVQAWSSGPFREWFDTRRAQMSALIETSEGVQDAPPYERAVAAALMGYAMEDLAADVRGAPVPEDISNDTELLQIYVDNLQQALAPVATEAVVYYAYCQRRLAALGDESEWLPWRAYCVQRGQEMIEVYGLAPPDQTAPDAEPASEDPAAEPAEAPAEVAPEPSS